MYPEHPGTIVFVDEALGTENARDAGGVPDSIKFAKLDDSWVCVTRVVAHDRGGQLVIRSYDAAGVLVSTTVQEPPR